MMQKNLQEVETWHGGLPPEEVLCWKLCVSVVQANIALPRSLCLTQPPATFLHIIIRTSRKPELSRRRRWAAGVTAAGTHDEAGHTSSRRHRNKFSPVVFMEKMTTLACSVVGTAAAVVLILIRP